jgi:hypothetical protein
MEFCWITWTPYLSKFRMLGLQSADCRVQRQGETGEVMQTSFGLGRCNVMSKSALEPNASVRDVECILVRQAPADTQHSNQIDTY